ncbi:MAG: alpha/beta hydrolase [Paludibacter sp.]|nr:MAG: alpha/beta hydrolase [Paludibacter sp.]
MSSTKKDMIKEELIKIKDYSLFVRQIIKDKEKPTIVYLHDSWGCVETWKDFPEQLSDKYNCNALIYDRRGYGKSDKFKSLERDKTYLHQSAEELISVVDYFGLEKVILYGHSDGASISTIFAQNYPKRVSAILLEGNHSFVEEKTKKGVKDCREKAKNNSLISSLKKYHSEKAEPLFRIWHEIWLNSKFTDWNIVEELNKIECPVLAFQGVNDEFGTVKQLEVIEQNVTSFKMTKEIENAGHTPRKENRQKTLEVIEQFMKKINIV